MENKWTYWKLKFPDKTSCDAVMLQEVGGQVLPKWPDTVFVGTLYHDDVPQEGYHVDLAVKDDLPSELLAYKIPFSEEAKHNFYTQHQEILI